MMSSARPKTGSRGLLASLAAALLALTTACSSGAAGSSTQQADSHTFTIGFALSQSGDMAPFDVEPGRAALLRVAEINAAGGINGMKIKTISSDVRSDPTTVGTAATSLISRGVNLLVLPCDLDLSSPGAAVAESAKVPAISICASDPKMANPATFGPYVFTANVGSDVEGSSGAQWAYNRGWKSAYLLQDQSISYTKSAGQYFAAKFKSLGGSIVGQSAFPGTGNIDISSQILKIKQANPKPAFIYVASWNPGGATAIRQLRDAGITTPVVGPAALDGKSLLKIVGNTRDVYYTAFGCYVYCSGQNSSGLDKFVSTYKAKYGTDPSSSYALLGYNLVSAIQVALEHTKSTSGKDVVAALEGSTPVSTPIGKVQYFSKTCHKIIGMPLTVIGVANSKMSYIGQESVTKLPDVGDGNPCAG